MGMTFLGHENEVLIQSGRTVLEKGETLYIFLSRSISRLRAIALPFYMSVFL